MKMLVMNRKIILSILVMLVLLCGLQDISSAADPPAVEFQVETEQALTAVNSNTFVVTLLLEGAAWAEISKIREAVAVSGIDGVGIKEERYDTGKNRSVWVCTSGCGGYIEWGYWTSKDVYDWRPSIQRKSDTVLEVPLTFDGTDFDTDATLTFTVKASAIADYNGASLTAIMPVITAVSAPLPLTEQNLGGSVVRFTLTGGKYAAQLLEGAVTVAGIAGVGVSDVVRKSDTVLEVPLTFDGTDFDTDETLALTVSPDAIANYSVPVTAMIPVTAVKESVSASATPPLTEATLDESIVSLVLTGAAFEQDISKIQEAVTVSGINGLTIDTTTLQRTSDRKVTVDLDYDGTDFDTDTPLAFSLASEAIANHNEELSTELPVTAIVEAVSASVVSPLIEGTLDGSIVTLNLTGLVYEQDISKIREAVTLSGINGVTVDTATVQRLGDRIVVVELDYDDTDFVRDTALIFSVAAGAITNYDSTAFTTELPVTANRNEDILTIFWTDGGTDNIQRVNMDGSNIEDLVTQGLSSPLGIALDVAGGKMYWTDFDTEKIQRANMDGSNIEDLVTQGLSSPLGIALDVAGGKMYWTDIVAEKIQRANLDGSNIEDLVTQGLSSPLGIALDVAGGKMYWTDIVAEKIQRANLDGSNIEDLVTQGLEFPYGISLDVEGAKMYWTDIIAEKIQRANLDGSNIEDLVTQGVDAPNSLALDVAGGKMYWTDSGTQKIQRANLDGSNIENLIIQGLDRPNGIAIGIISPVNPTTETEAPTITKEDVNDDGVVDVNDLVIVAQQYGQTGTNVADVNGDEIVNVDDFILVAAAIDNAAAAPAARAQVRSHFTKAQLQGWLTEARASGNTSRTYQRGIAVLERLLALFAPEETALLANYPNPFNPETWIPYQLSKPADVTLTIYDIKGRVVRALYQINLIHIVFRFHKSIETRHVAAQCPSFLRTIDTD